MSGMADIAEEVGVSVSLVSKVLTGRMGKSSVRPELARRIKDCAGRMGYVPNITARSLVKKRRNVIGVFFQRYGQPGSGLVETVVCELSKALSERSQSLLLKFFSNREQFAECLKTAHRSVMDGVVMVGPFFFDPSPYMYALADKDIPLASLSDKAPCAGASNVGVSPVEVGRLAALHLIGRGCRRIATFQTEFDPRRALGYRIAMEECGLSQIPELSLTTNGYGAGTAPRLIEELLDSGTAFDGVITCSDAQAAVVLRVLLSRGVRVPEEVKVIGVDNSPYCELCPVPLTSVSGRDDYRAAAAVRLLLRQIDGGAPESVSVEPVVVARESTRAL